MSIPTEHLDELLDSRLAGESDLEWCVRRVRQVTGYWQEAVWTLRYSRTQIVSRILLDFFVEREVRMRGRLTDAVELLSEELKKVAAANPPLTIHRSGVANGR